MTPLARGGLPHGLVNLPLFIVSAIEASLDLQPCQKASLGPTEPPMNRPRLSIRAMVLAGALAFCACAGSFDTVAPLAPAHHEQLGQASSQACGSLVLAVIPVALNDRVGRAYEGALAQRPGAIALIDVTLTENWFIWLFGITRCTTISGVAIR